MVVFGFSVIVESMVVPNTPERATQSSRRRLLIPATQPAPAARDDDAVVAAGGALSDHRAFQAGSCYSCRASCLPPPIARPTGVLACACTALKVRAPVLALVAVRLMLYFFKRAIESAFCLASSSVSSLLLLLLFFFFHKVF